MTPTNFVGVFVFINNLILLFYLYIRLFYRNNLKQYIYEKQFKTIQNNSKQFKTIQKVLVASLLLIISVTGFYACKKNEKSELLDPNAVFRGELKTYHESQDYKNLVLQFPDQEFVDMPIFNANTRMKAIVTNIYSSSGVLVKAVTYFEPESNGTNTWYPTIVTKMTSDLIPITEMQEKKNFSGILEILSSKGVPLSKTIVKNNLIIDLDSNFPLQLNVNTETISSNGKLMYVSGGTKECLGAMNRCWADQVRNMGLIAYAGYCATFPTSAVLILADCMLHEKACLGINKPSAVADELID